MPRCSFCGDNYEIPRGLTLVLNDGTQIFLCSSKCRKNFAMKRKKRKWADMKANFKEAKKSENS